MSLNSIIKGVNDDTYSLKVCRQLENKSLYNGKNSPGPSKAGGGRGSPKPYSTPDVSRCQSLKDYQLNQSLYSSRYMTFHDNPKNVLDRKTPIWHNPSKSDKILTTDCDNYALCKRDKESKNKEPKCSLSKNKFNSLPRKKSEKCDKDVAAETYGTLGRHRKKIVNKDSSKTNTANGYEKVISQDSKNTLDKYATLPRKKAKEVSAKWREHLSKGKHGLLQRSRSTGKTDADSPKPSPLLTNSLGLSSYRTSNTPTGIKSLEPSSFTNLFPKRSSLINDKNEKILSPSKYSKFRSQKRNAAVQVDIALDSPEKDLQMKLQVLSDDYTLLQSRLTVAEANAQEVEELRMEVNELRKTADMERQEKEEIQEELDRTSTKVKDMLTSMEGVEREFNNRGDSLIELEGQLQNSTEINMKLQEKLNQSEEFSVKLRKDLDKSLASQKILLQQVQDLETEGREITEFMAEEKNALSECLREAEAEVGRVRKDCEELSLRLMQKDEEARHMVRLAEERRKEFLSLQSEINSMQSQTQDIMVCHGAEVSSASISLANLISRLQTLSGKLIEDYNISDNDIESIVTPTDLGTYCNSFKGTPQHPPSPTRSLARAEYCLRRPTSFMQTFLNAMGVAYSASKAFIISSKDKNIQKRKSISERGYTEELNEGILTERMNDESNPTLSLLDQINEADAVLSRFLKVCCVLKSDADNILNELEKENEQLCNQLQECAIDLPCNKYELENLKIVSKELQRVDRTLVRICEENGNVTHFEETKEDSVINCSNTSLYPESTSDQTLFAEVDLIVNHVLKTLESVPDVVSSCSILRNLYISLTSQDYSAILPQKSASPLRQEQTNKEPLNGNEVSYDCNANPDPEESTFLRSTNSTPKTEAVDSLLPFLTNETAL